jgi:hypothetical protein
MQAGSLSGNGGGCLTGVVINVTAEQFDAAKRIMALVTLEAIKLIHVRAAHMNTADCPVKVMEEKARPSASAAMITGTNQFRVVVGHVITGRHGAEIEIQVDANFELIYSVPADANPTPEELQAFADTNALLNCWPYWRELVHDMAARMELPPLLLPLFRLTVSPPPSQEDQSVRPEQPQPSKANA